MVSVVLFLVWTIDPCLRTTVDGICVDSSGLYVHELREPVCVRNGIACMYAGSSLYACGILWPVRVLGTFSLRVGMCVLEWAKICLLLKCFYYQASFL